MEFDKDFYRIAEWKHWFFYIHKHFIIIIFPFGFSNNLFIINIIIITVLYQNIWLEDNIRIFMDRHLNNDIF